MTKPQNVMLNSILMHLDQLVTAADEAGEVDTLEQAHVGLARVSARLELALRRDRQPSQEDRALTAAQAAPLLGLSAYTVAEWMRTGKLRTTARIGRPVRVMLSEVRRVQRVRDGQR